MSKLIIADQAEADVYYSVLEELMARFVAYHTSHHLLAGLVHQIHIMDVLAALDEFERGKRRKHLAEQFEKMDIMRRNPADWDPYA